MGERFMRGFITSTKLLIAGGIFFICACAVLFCHPVFVRLLLDVEETVDSSTMAGTTCETLQADLAFSREIPPLSAREIQKDDNPESNTQNVTPDEPVISRRIAESADLAYFYGEDVIACFGNPTYYYAFWQQEPEARALIVELVYPKEGLIFSSYSSSNWQGRTATLHPKSEFQRIRRIPPIISPTDLAPHLSYPWYHEKPRDPSWVNSTLREWEGWDQIVLPEP